MNLEVLEKNSYPGRGIILGKSKCGRYAVAAYFIMGRSENSRNRRFVIEGDGIRTEAVDEAKLKDPSLVIYHPVRILENNVIVTNGDQTDTIYDFIKENKTFEAALNTREYEPDEPIFTPRISGIITFENDSFTYKLSILKNPNQQKGTPCERLFYEYDTPVSGIAHLIHTYKTDGNPAPSFDTAPIQLEIKGGTKELAKNIWAALDDENKVSLFVRRINIKTGEASTEIINKYK